MKPVNQTKMTPPNGDCFAACIASILELPLNEVPNYSQQGEWWLQWNEWLSKRGLYLVEFHDQKSKGKEYLKGYHIITGKSYSGDWNHSVVGMDGEIVHDPNPAQKGIRSHQWYGVFVAINPAIHYKGCCK